MKYLSLSLIFTGVVVLGLESPGQAANLINNGSFEDYQSAFAPNQSYKTLSAGSTEINDWEVTGGGIKYYLGGGWTGSNSDYVLDLSASGLGGIRQTFDTIIGNKYRLTFDLSRNIGINTPPILRTSAAGEFQDFAFSPTSPMDFITKNVQWETQIWEFEAKDTTTTLELFMIDNQPLNGTIVSANTYSGTALDNISIISLSPPSPLEPTSNPLEPTSNPLDPTDAEGVPETQTVIGILLFGLLAFRSRNQTNQRD
ncbi:DUF642 domain-containing protein [Crocosphaera sp. UHCC 0190]|uniref:DUF642 domain-containing protein n=1 Tax=Crocosphaera sp. UHCC 0190 TaxID=3110246 RepID=UPI002B206373|nr:DUF642 domain-containing protein [Crocosphaera sp. UHCC 0190]MEA5509379.1 DUF642 domain-containing protein [Crocosphaera sp. UHCC 0190]